MKPRNPSHYLSFALFICLLFGARPAMAQYDGIDAYALLTTNPTAFRAYLVANPDYVVNLKGANLSGLDLSNMRLKNADLSYTKLMGANLKESDLTGANFMGANLTNTDFSRSDVSYANFDKSNATGANFVESKFKNTITDYLLIQDGYQLNPAYIDIDGIVKPRSK